MGERMVPEEELEHLYWCHEFLDRAPFIALRIDMDGKYIWANQDSLADIGLTLGELRGKGPEAVMHVLHPDSQPLVAQSVTRAMTEKRPDEVLVKIKKAGKGWRWMRHIIAPWYKLDGAMGGLDLLCLDITDVKEKERMQEALSRTQTLEAVGVLAAGIAHDFNNLLQVILGFSELGIEGTSEENENFERYTKIKNAAKKASDLAMKLLSFTKHAGQEEFLESLAPHRLAEDAMDLFRRGLLKKRPGIKVEMSIAAGLPKVTVDRNDLTRALLNLLKNSMEAVDVQGGRIILEVVALSLEKDDIHDLTGVVLVPGPGDYIVFRVQDNGCGMSATVRKRAFEPFFTTKGMGKGTGLGLFTTAGVVRRHGGGALLETEENRGTTVTLLLPAGDTRGEQGQGFEWYKSEQAGKKLPRGTETVLVVDDEEINLDVAHLTLSSRGYEVLRTHDPDKALKWIQERSVDLVLLDMVMPKVGGAQLFRQLKKVKPELKVVAVSGYAAPEDIHEMRREGLRGWLQKPYSIADLCWKVRSVLDSP
ncbi:MAG: response regulator [Deltaproteobacteria bacterium]|nr:response regulator [Deltaproteobacteria bacterium]